MGVQAVLSAKKAENRAIALARQAQDLKLVPLYGVTYDLSRDFFKVSIKIAGRSYHCGYFDDANAAGHRADEVSVLLGTPQKCNFDADGNPKTKVIPITAEASSDPAKGMEEMSAEFRKRGSEIYQ